MFYSPNGLALTKKSEGCVLTAYRDSGGVWTIGYGHTGMVNGVPIHDGMVIDLNTAVALLMQDLREAVAFVNAAVKVPVLQCQFDAMVDFCFNLGCEAFKGSTLLRLVNLGEPHLAATQFALWDHCDGVVVPGLARRRAAEEAMFSACTHNSYAEA